MKRILTLGAIIGCLALPASAEGFQWSGTGPKGGTVTGGGACTHADGTAACDRGRTYTGPNGATATVKTEAVRSRDGGSRTTTRVGPLGRTGTVTVERSR